MSSKRSWGDFRAKRTEAMPKSTLFGSSLEMKDEEQRKQLSNIDLKEYQEQLAAPKKSVTSNSIPGANEVLEYNKQLLAVRNLEATRATNLVNTLEERSKYFTVGVSDPALREKIEASRADMWMSAKDLDHAGEINNVGYKNGRSYNHHLYKPKPPNHQYALIGNVLQTGGDFIVDRDVPQAFPPEAYMNKPRGKKQPRLPGIKSNESHPSSDVPNAMELPANIRHQFGTSVCMSALADPYKVRQSMLETEAHNRAMHRMRRYQDETVTVTDDKTDSNYEALGLALRQNVFPGYAYDHLKSHTKSVYTPEVHKGKQMVPDEWRYQRDALSSWAEQNVLREKMKKAWELYLSGAVKA